MNKKEIKRCAQACINTYVGKYGKCKKVFDTVVEFERGDVQGHYGIKGDTLYIVFQGSQGKRDWRDNFKFWQKDVRKIKPYGNRASKIKVHYGFIRQYKQARSYLHKIIKQLNPAHIVCTGHSLGGSLATLCSVDIQYNFPDKFIECCTFGSPRVGNKAFADSFDRRVQKSLRYVNGSDVVCSVPIWGYEHVSAKRQIGKRAWWKIWSTADHYPDRYMMNL